MLRAEDLVGFGIPMDRVYESMSRSGGICCVCEEQETEPVTKLSFNPFSLDENPEVIHVGFRAVCDKCSHSIEDSVY